MKVIDRNFAGRAKFIQKYIEPMLQAMDSDIHSVVLTVEWEGDEMKESVVISHLSGGSTTVIDVTNLNPAQIIAEIILEEYEN